MDDNLLGSCDYRQLPQYNQYLVGQGWRIEHLGATALLLRRFPIIGTILILKRGDPKTSVEAIEQIVTQHQAALVKLDFDIDYRTPEAETLKTSLLSRGYYLSRLPFCPTKTIKIDVSLPLETLLEQASSDVRRYLRKNEKENFLIRHDQTIDDFYPLLQKASKIHRYFLPSLNNIKKQWEAFGPNLQVITGYKDGQLLGGAMVVCQNAQASGIYMAFNEMGLSCHLPYSMMWEAVVVAKNAGCRVLDLDGVYDERFKAPVSWKGLSVFKKKFGGVEVEYPGTYVKCRFLPTQLLTALKLL